MPEEEGAKGRRGTMLEQCKGRGCRMLGDARGGRDTETQATEHKTMQGMRRKNAIQCPGNPAPKTLNAKIRVRKNRDVA